MESSFANRVDSWARRARASGCGLALLLGSFCGAGCAREADLDDFIAAYGSAGAPDAGVPYPSPPGPESSGGEARDSTATLDAIARDDAGSSLEDARLSPEGSIDA